MKRFFLILLALTMVLALAAGNLTALAEGGSAETTTPTEAPTQAPTEAPTETPTEAPTQAPTEAPTTPTEAPTEAPTTPTEAPTEAPTTEPVPGIPVVTKSPTGETVREGGFAEFVARADYCKDIIWHLRSPGGGTDVLVKDAGSQFPGLVVTGLNTERLGLNNIPMALNEWRVLAEFVGADGNVWSNSAIITVMNQELTAPTISQQPISANLKATEGTTLRITAMTSERNTSLTYQWYKNTINSNVGGKAILGATGASFTPDYVPGTTYYYCAVRCTNGSEFSPTTKSTCAAVTYVTTPEATTVPVTQAATVPTAMSPTTATLTPWNEVTAPSETETLPEEIPNAPARSNTLLVIIVGVIILIAVLGIIATVLILKFYPRDDDDDPRPPRQTPPRAPQSPAQRRQSPPQSAHTPKFAAKPTAPEPQEEQWDDLSDLGDLSIYLDDQDDEDQ